MQHNPITVEVERKPRPIQGLSGAPLRKEVEHEEQNGFKIFTGHEDGVIKQDMIQVHDGVVISHAQELLDTKDQHVIDTLIELGWTPPVKTEESKPQE